MLNIHLLLSRNIWSEYTCRVTLKQDKVLKKSLKKMHNVKVSVSFLRFSVKLLRIFLNCNVNFLHFIYFSLQNQR